MIITPSSGGQRSRPVTYPAFGPAEPLGRRRRAGVLVTLVGLLALALVIRASGLLHGDRVDPSLPPLPAAAVVVPGVVRGGQPSDIDLVRLRDDYGGRGLVDVDGMTVEEQASAHSLGLPTLQLHVPEGGAPTAAELVALADFIRSTGPGPGAGRIVYLHDTTGDGSVLTVSAMLRLLRGAPLSDVLDPAPKAGFTAGQLLALRQLDAVVRDGARTDGPYAALRGVSW